MATASLVARRRGDPDAIRYSDALLRNSGIEGDKCPRSFHGSNVRVGFGALRRAAPLPLDSAPGDGRRQPHVLARVELKPKYQPNAAHRALYDDRCETFVQIHRQMSSRP